MQIVNDTFHSKAADLANGGYHETVVDDTMASGVTYDDVVYVDPRASVQVALEKNSQDVEVLVTNSAKPFGEGDDPAAVRIDSGTSDFVSSERFGISQVIFRTSGNTSATINRCVTQIRG